MHLRLHQPLRVPEQYGYYGRDEPEGQVGQHVCAGAEEELDGVAVGAGGEL